MSLIIDRRNLQRMNPGWVETEAERQSEQVRREIIIGEASEDVFVGK